MHFQQPEMFRAIETLRKERARFENIFPARGGALTFWTPCKIVLLALLNDLSVYKLQFTRRKFNKILS